MNLPKRKVADWNNKPTLPSYSGICYSKCSRWNIVKMWQIVGQLKKKHLKLLTSRLVGNPKPFRGQREASGHTAGGHCAVPSAQRHVMTTVVADELYMLHEMWSSHGEEGVNADIYSWHLRFAVRVNKVYPNGRRKLNCVCYPWT
jgi:hypothetical protein